MLAHSPRATKRKAPSVRPRSPSLPSPTMSPRVVCDTLLPSQLDAITSLFESLPDPLKNSLLESLLKRAPYATLKHASSLILPALKCDFLALLPVELSYLVAAHLDVRSLARCQAVSRAWARVIGGAGADVAVWKRRLYAEGFADDAEIALALSRSVFQFQDTDQLLSLQDMDISPSLAPLPPNPRLRSLRSHSSSLNCDPIQLSAAFPTSSSSSSYKNTAILPDASPLHPFFADSPAVPTSAAHYLQPIPIQNPARNIYKNLYKKHHLIRSNWFLGKHRRIAFPGHGLNVVTCLQFDTDKIVSGSDDQTIHIYETATGSLLKRLNGHEGGVWALKYWNNALVSGSTDRSVRVWDMTSGECTHIFDGHTSTVRCLDIIVPKEGDATDDGISPLAWPVIVTGSRDSTIRVWRLPDPARDPRWSPAIAAQLHQQQQHQQQATAVGPDNSAVLSSSANPYFMHMLTGHTNSVRAMAGQGNVLVSGSYDCTVRVWHISTGECMHVFRGHTQKVYSVGYSHELRRAVSGSMDHTVKVWCTRSGIALFNLEGHTSLVGLLEISPQYLVTAAADSTLRIWSPVTGQCLSTLTGHTAAITCFHHDPKSNRIVSGSDGGIKIWELSSYGYGTTASPTGGIIPRGCPLYTQLSFTQGPSGPEPAYGRLIRDEMTSVQGVWRLCMDERRLVCAVQRETHGTFFEVFDFSDTTDGGGGEHGAAEGEGGLCTPTGSTLVQAYSDLGNVAGGTSS